MESYLQIALVVLIVLGVIGLLAYRRRMLATVAYRNIVRRKTYSAIVTAGLMIATAMIGASLVVGDTLDYVIKKETFDATGNTDIVLATLDSNGYYTYFNESEVAGLLGNAQSGSMRYVDAAAPAIRDRVTVLDVRTNLPFPTATLFGYDPANMINPLYDELGQAVMPLEVTNGSMVINRALADEVNAVAGDQIMVMTEHGAMVPFTVSTIASDKAMGKFNNGESLFMDISSAQLLMNESGKINVVDVSCSGSIQSGYLMTGQAIAEVTPMLPPGHDWDLATIKADGVEAAQSTSDLVSQLFVVMSSFAIIAGIALITNIFVMLAEERKPEMGISRAIGMQRGDLTQSFMFEGAVYALMSSAIGAGVGLLIASLMVEMFASSFTAMGLTIPFHFEWSSVAIAACAGFLITMATVAVASWRVSKLNIVRAIRDIPEPAASRRDRRLTMVSFLLLGLGALMLMQGVSALSLVGTVAGPSLMALGAALLGSRFIGSRWPFTAASAFILFWVLDPLNVKDVFGNLSGDIDMFIVSGVLLVTAGVFIVMFNSDWLLTGLVRVFGRKESTLPVVKVAVSYPLNKKFRTGLSLFIFALIMFTVIIISVLASIERASVTTTTENFSGGFQIVGFSFRDIDHQNLTAHLQHLDDTFEKGAVARAEIARTGGVQITQTGPNSTDTNDYSMVGLPTSVLLDNRFTLSDRDPRFATDADAWRAVAEPNSSYVIMDGTVKSSIFMPGMGSTIMYLGEQISINSSLGIPRNFTVIGFMNQMVVTGAFASEDTVASFVPQSKANLFYFATSPHMQHSEKELAKALEAEFVQYGLVTYSIRDMIAQVMGMITSIMRLFEVFLGIGLIVGITGLGIITIRNVAERKQEIGVMRAIGYQRNMVLNTFLAETSFVSLLGILLGVVLGLALSRQLYDWGDFDKTAPFVVPWLEIAAIVGVAFLVSLASTLPPSRRASRLAPAEALRRLD